MKKYKVTLLGKSALHPTIFDSTFPNFPAAVGFAEGLFSASDLDVVTVCDCDTTNSVHYDRKEASKE